MKDHGSENLSTHKEDGGSLNIGIGAARYVIVK